MENDVPNAEFMELEILRNFFEKIFAGNPGIAGNDIPAFVKQTESQLTEALRNSPYRCTCAKRRYGPCEVCQASTGPIYQLRIFFRMIKNAKRFNISEADLQQLFKNTHAALYPSEPLKKKKR